jgi:hypothetical protein
MEIERRNVMTRKDCRWNLVVADYLFGRYRLRLWLFDDLPAPREQVEKHRQH